jgi:hypothetical protein
MNLSVEMKDVRLRVNPLHDVRCLTAIDQAAETRTA